MKKLILLFIAFSTSVSFTPAQTQYANVKWGPVIQKESKRGEKQFGGFDDTGYYFLATNYPGLFKTHYLLQKLDPDLNLIASEDYGTMRWSDKPHSEISQLNMIGNRLFAFIYETERDSNKLTFYGQEINKTTLKPLGKPVKLIERDSRYSTKIKIEISKDRSKVLITDAPLSMAVCDASLNILWEKKFQYPYDDVFWNMKKCKCDNEGNVAILGEHNSFNHITSYSNKGADKVDYEIKSEAGNITGVDFDFSDKHDIVVSGFYSKPGGPSVEVVHKANAYKKVGPSSVDGTFYMMLDPIIKNVKVSTVKEFGIDFITQTMTKKEEKKARSKEDKGDDLELMHYSLHDFVLRHDGGVVLVGEQNYTVMASTNNSRPIPDIYHYDNLLVVTLDHFGKTEMAPQLIPKMQISDEDRTGQYSSFSLQAHGDNLHFIFNDNKDNLEAGAIESAIKSIKLDKDKGVVAIATIDSKGKLSRDEFLSKEDLKVTVLPRTFTQIGDNKMLIIGNRKKNEQFAIVDFK